MFLELIKTEIMRIKKASVVIRFELSLGKLNSSNKLFPAQL